MTIDKDSMNIK